MAILEANKDPRPGHPVRTRPQRVARGDPRVAAVPVSPVRGGGALTVPTAYRRHRSSSRASPTHTSPSEPVG